MIRLWRKSITSKRHYEIFTKVYPYADKIERKALGNIVEKDAIKSRLEKIANYRKSLPKINGNAYLYSLINPFSFSFTPY